MLAQYLDKAMEHAHYERIEDGTYFGSIPGFAGVWADAATEAACADELREVLEGWVLLHIADHTPLPTVDGLALSVGDPV
jgi:predicted RNase H-like HicB family nuclease